MIEPQWPAVSTSVGAISVPVHRNDWPNVISATDGYAPGGVVAADDRERRRRRERKRGARRRQREKSLDGTVHGSDNVPLP